ncbi:MAG TPA: OmpA family protein [Spirochaetota bacterium]|nr:OmpA family protein [Spirochaetota bacterium]
MKIKKSAIIIIQAVTISLVSFMNTANASGLSDTSPAGSAFLSGGSAYYMGRAGTGVSASGGDLLPVNPASMAVLERFRMSFNYGSLDSDFQYPYAALAFPTAYGVLGLGGGYFTIDGEGEIEQKGYLFSFGMAKEVTSKFLFGISFEGMYSEYIETNYYAGIKPGFIYRFDGTSTVNGFGFLDPAIGITANIGFSSGDDTDLSLVTAGYNFDFYRSRTYSLGFYNDISVIEGYGKYPVKFGLETAILNSFYLRAGAVVPGSYEFMTYTGGAGYKFTGDTFTASINYALSYSEEQGVSHFAGITLEYGALDREPPALSITPDYTYISPNYDGVQDYLVFSTEVRDQSRIRGWKLQISDEKDAVVKEFKMSDREIDESLTVSAFFKRLVSTKDSMTVPEKILWDGSDNSGIKLPDGKYKYYFYAWDARDNIAPVKSGVIAIDSTSPAVDINTDSMIFSPNGDRNKDTLIIHQKIKSSPEDIWKGEIKNSNGITVASFEWSGSSVPEKVVWKGIDDSGTVLPDGLYFYSILSTDKAGNKASASLREIILTTKMEIADIRFEDEYFSYKKDNKKTIRFFPDLSSVKGIERWEVTISDSDDKKIIRTLSGTGIIPAYIDWDCRDAKGELLDDGVYNVRFAAWYSSGNNPVSFPKKVVFDSTKPVISISHDPALFSPDDDGENDYLTLNMKAADNSGFDRWEINIYNESGILFKKFSGRGVVPQQLKWDGIGSSNELVESASDYDVQFTAVDPAGNISETATDKIPVDILVVVTERGLKMRVSNIEFGFGSSSLKKRGTKILDRVYQILEKYGSYNVVVEGHTDDIGDEEYNLKLSEKRALAVKNYLITKGTGEARLKYVGMGESSPFYPNTSEENRRRNRRVEFLLVKEKDIK